MYMYLFGYVSRVWKLRRDLSIAAKANRQNKAPGPSRSCWRAWSSTRLWRVLPAAGCSNWPCLEVHVGMTEQAVCFFYCCWLSRSYWVVLQDTIAADGRNGQVPGGRRRMQRLPRSRLTSSTASSSSTYWRPRSLTGRHMCSCWSGPWLSNSIRGP